MCLPRNLMRRRALEPKILYSLPISAHQETGDFSLRVASEANAPVATDKQVARHRRERLSGQLQSAQQETISLDGQIVRDVKLSA